jgi:hypothetical protein
VPGKLFEYLAVGRPILAVAPAESSTADVLKLTGGGWLAPPGDAAGIACVLRQVFEAHRAAQSPRPDPASLGRFDRRALTGELSKIFEQVSRDARRV